MSRNQTRPGHHRTDCTLILEPPPADHFASFFFPPLSHLICRKWAEKFDWDTSACKLHWTLRSHWLNLQGLSELSAHWVCSMELSKCSFLQCSWCVHISVNKRNLLVQWRYKFDCKVTLSKSTMFLLKNEWKDLLVFDKSEPINSPMVAFLEICAPGWLSEISSWMSWKTVNKTTVPSRRDQRGDQIHESKLEKRAYDLPHFSDNKHQCIFLSLIETFMALFSNSQEKALMEVAYIFCFGSPRSPDDQSGRHLPLPFLIVLLVKDNFKDKAAALKVQEEISDGWFCIFGAGVVACIAFVISYTWANSF